MTVALNPRTASSVAEALRLVRALLPGHPQLAARNARGILAFAPDSAEAYRLLGAALRQTGDSDAANEAELAAIAASVRDPELLRAAQALVSNDLPKAESTLRPLLHRRPTEVAAIRMMAELAARVGRPRDAENLLRRALELAPGWVAARANLATVLYRQNRWTEALDELDRIEVRDEETDSSRSLKAALLGRVGAHQEAIGLYRKLLERHPDQPKIWLSLGHLLKTVGETGDAIAAYRRSIGVRPAFGEAWWSLANMKVFRFSDEDVAAMRSVLETPGLDEVDRLHLHFALGKALEDRGEAADAFANYEQANRIRSAEIPFEPDRLTRQVGATIAIFSKPFLNERAGQGCEAPDPIFILGMPRAGSTLIEQILASHSMIEGTAELPDIIMLAKRLGESGDYPAFLGELPPDELRGLGEEYLERTRIHRSSDRPFFVDKMPNNWAHAGLIRLILPNAKIIDARRHPLACCFSNFKQHYARGQAFSYNLEHLGRYYADYVRLMAHFDQVAPGAVHRVTHERLVAQPEAEIRRLLDYLALPFQESCLRFHETKRAVATPSSEQVRRPLSSEGLEQWKQFDAWLGPLKSALGPALDSWDADASAQ